MQELLVEVNWGLIAPLLVIQGILIIIALTDLIRNEHPNGPKWMWALIICLVSMLGPVLYFVVGRRQN